MSQAEKKVSTQLAVSQTALLLISEASIHFFNYHAVHRYL